MRSVIRGISLCYKSRRIAFDMLQVLKYYVLKFSQKFTHKLLYFSYISYISHCLGLTCSVISPSVMPYPTTALHAILHLGFDTNICSSCFPMGDNNSLPFVTPTTHVAHVPSEPQSPVPPESNRCA